MILFSLALFSSSVLASNLQLMPYPKEIKMGDGKFMLDKIYHKVNSDEKSTFAKMHIVGGTKEDEPTKEENLWTRLSSKK